MIFKSNKITGFLHKQKSKDLQKPQKSKAEREGTTKARWYTGPGGEVFGIRDENGSRSGTYSQECDTQKFKR